MRLERFHAPLIALVVGLILLVVNFPIPKANEGGIPITEYGSWGFVTSCVLLAASVFWFLFIAFGAPPKGAKPKKSTPKRKGKKRR